MAAGDRWLQDDWYYVVQGGRYVRTVYYRRFPDRNNQYVYDLFANGQFVRRVDETPPAVRDAQHLAQLQLVLYLTQLAVLNQQNPQAALARAQIMGSPGYLGGATLGPTPHIYALTGTELNNRGTQAGQLVNSIQSASSNRGTAIVLR